MGETDVGSDVDNAPPSSPVQGPKHHGDIDVGVFVGSPTHERTEEAHSKHVHTKLSS